MAGAQIRPERHAARLAAVQALYQMELTGEDAESVAQQFRDHRFGEPQRDTATPDEALFSDLVHGVPRHQIEIDRSISEGLSERWRLQRIDSILRAILRAAIYELLARKDVPVKVVIDEYLNIAHAFFAGEEPAFVNALLDRVARRKRAAELGEPLPDDELRF